MPDIGTFTEAAYPAFRNATVDTLILGRRRMHIPFLLEIDVTEGRRRMAEAKARTGQAPSFTAWIVKGLGQAVSEHKAVCGFRKGRRRLVVFDDVDVSVVVERAVEGPRAPAQTLPMPTVIRRAEAKSLAEIQEGIRAAQGGNLAPGQVDLTGRTSLRLLRLFVRLPRPLRHALYWRRLMRNPFLFKKTMGTVAVTSIGSAGKGGGQGWAVPIGLHPLIVTVGGIARKPGLDGEAIAVRELLDLTLLFDHEVIDGAPVARFIRRLKELLESGFGLEG